MAAPRRPDGRGRARRGGAEALSPALGPAGGRFWTAVSSLWPFGGGGGRGRLLAGTGPEPLGLIPHRSRPGCPAFGWPVRRGPGECRAPPSRPRRLRVTSRLPMEEARRAPGPEGKRAQKHGPGPGGRTAGPQTALPAHPEGGAERRGGAAAAGSQAAESTCGGTTGLPPTRAALHAADAPPAARRSWRRDVLRGPRSGVCQRLPPSSQSSISLRRNRLPKPRFPPVLCLFLRAGTQVRGKKEARSSV